MSQSQFLVLYRIFLHRVVDLEILAADADSTRLVAQYMSLCGGISLLLTLPLVLLGGPPMTLSAKWTIEHFFIATTMTAVGILTLLNWESALPDKRDILVLTPLPVPAQTLFAAKVAAFLAAPGLTVVSLNFFSGLLWPLLFAASDHGLLGILKAWPAYWISVSAAAAFIVFSVLAVQGLAACLLPRQLFLRLSPLLQIAFISLLLSLYFLEPSLETPEALLDPANQRILAFLPAYWFLGLFQQLNGSMHPALAPLANRAWDALAVSVSGAAAALLLAFFRTLPRTIEQPDTLPVASGAGWPLPHSNSLTGAITLFSFRTILRSRQHRTILSFYVGIGIAIVLGYIQGPFAGVSSQSPGIGTPFLLSTTVMMILPILAIRVIASIPITLPANWIIRATQVRPAIQYHRAVRWSWLILGVLPVLGSVLSLSLFATYPWRSVLGHLGALSLLGLFLVECCLSTFPKIPFTCSYLPGKANIHVIFWIALLVVIRLLDQAARIEEKMLHHLPSYLLMLITLASDSAVIRRLSALGTKPDDELLFEEQYTPDLISLNLR